MEMHVTIDEFKKLACSASFKMPESDRIPLFSLAFIGVDPVDSSMVLIGRTPHEAAVMRMKSEFIERVESQSHEPDAYVIVEGYSVPLFHSTILLKESAFEDPKSARTLATMGVSDSILGLDTGCGCSGQVKTLTNRGDRLPPGGYLAYGDYLQSRNGRWQLHFQSDGNVVMYPTGSRDPIWATNSCGGCRRLLPRDWKGTHAIFQPDGNFVVYYIQSNRRYVFFATATERYSPGVLVMQDDRNLVVYDGDGIARWDSGTYEAPRQHWEATEEFRCRLGDWEESSGTGATETEAINRARGTQDRKCAFIGDRVHEQRNLRTRRIS